MYKRSGGIFIKQRTDPCVREEKKKKKKKPPVLFSEAAHVHMQADLASSRPTGAEHLSLSCAIISIRLKRDKEFRMERLYTCQATSPFQRFPSIP